MSDSEDAKNECSSIKSEADFSNYGTRIPNRVFVGGLSSNTDEGDIRSKFSKYGQVKFAKIIRDNMGSSKGYGFVTFATEEDANNVIEKAQIVIKGRRLNIAPAVKRQLNQSDSCSSEMASSTSSMHEVPPAASAVPEIPRYQSKTNYLMTMDNSHGINSWNVPYFSEPSCILSGTHLNAAEHSNGNTQANCTLPYPALVYIPQYPYQQSDGFSYPTYGSFPDFIPVIAVPMPGGIINGELQ